jgi:hypothetical protein
MFSQHTWDVSCQIAYRIANREMNWRKSSRAEIPSDELQPMVWNNLSKVIGEDYGKTGLDPSSSKFSVFPKTEKNAQTVSKKH